MVRIEEERETTSILVADRPCVFTGVKKRNGAVKAPLTVRDGGEVATVGEERETTSILAVGRPCVFTDVRKRSGAVSNSDGHKPAMTSLVFLRKMKRDVLGYFLHLNYNYYF
ncbi:hypothetical protein FXO38_17671 [Capsicum annuum]|nr:hypothetical protein FXO37_25874 [Capsicum annuum]KAF3649412.1 hypothetical protein FXO38_17671 [Capsicum annuum]